LALPGIGRADGNNKYSALIFTPKRVMASKRRKTNLPVEPPEGRRERPQSLLTMRFPALY